MANGYQAAIQQEEEAAEQAYEAALVNPLDVAFVLILPLAIFADAIDIILEILGILVVPKLIGMLLDALTLPIGWWVAQRTGAIMSAKDQRDQLRAQQAQQRQERAATLQQQIQKAERGVGATRNPARRAWRKVLLFFLLELVPFVGIFPFWTIAVIGTLRAR